VPPVPPWFYLPLLCENLLEMEEADELDSLQLASALRRAYREVTVRLAREVSQNQLSQLEYHLLLDLAGTDGLSQFQIADHLQAPKTRVSTLVRGLTAKALVESFRPEEDRRQVRVRLTGAGRTRLLAAQQGVRRALDDFASHMPREHLLQLLEMALRRYLSLDVSITLGH
jgi:DNA-binding MarR family transcriptional regulator